ncbi:RusA family crossover junction endodeoxyribonuclease [Methylorubrum populi]|uniref:Endodeoxyribonuclease RusA n=1 Tax=Methylorubrum populi TaxID=223967 RepID=A0A833J4E7_9HYPH|nr:RusA family crossover junction endodeoxyribonuclease [Methylorubrum populi]KAB7783452.1 endodeoxyribonuclease RusA [Methylorubrum populi]
MRAPSLSSRNLGARLKPEERPVYAQRRIVPSVEIRFPLPPSTNSLFANVVGRGRVKTPKYRAWRQQAALLIDVQRPGRMAGPCDVAIYLPPFRGDIDNRVKPCLDVAVAAGIIADDGQRYLRGHPLVGIDRTATDVRMVFTMPSVEEQDRAEIEVRAREGQNCAHIAVSLGLDEGHVRTVLAEIGR